MLDEYDPHYLAIAGSDAHDQTLDKLRKPIRVVEDYLRQLRAGSAVTDADMDTLSSDAAVAALNAFEELAGFKVVLKENKEKIMNDTAEAEDVVVSLCVMEAIYKVVERRVEEAKTIEEVERVRSQATLQQADRRFASIPKSLDVDDVVKQVTAPQAVDGPAPPSEIPIQRFCELLDAVDFPGHALESVQRLVEKEKTEHTAPGGVLECMPKKDLPRRSELKVAQLIERVSPIVQSMEERIAKFFLLTRSQEDTKALLLTLAILRRQHELLDETDPKFIVDVEEVNSMLARMAGWANKGVSAASFHRRVLESMGKAAGASQTSKK